MELKNAKLGSAKECFGKVCQLNMPKGQSGLYASTQRNLRNQNNRVISSKSLTVTPTGLQIIVKT